MSGTARDPVKECMRMGQYEVAAPKGLPMVQAVQPEECGIGHDAGGALDWPRIVLSTNVEQRGDVHTRKRGVEVHRLIRRQPRRGQRRWILSEPALPRFCRQGSVRV